MSVSKPSFKRNDDFVAVRPIKLSRKIRLMPGEAVDDTNTKLHLRQHFWRRNEIGPVGHPWTLAQIKAWDERCRRQGGRHEREEILVEQVEATRDREEVDADQLPEGLLSWLSL